ncbi:MAG: type II toxin-antitoxin system RelE/ParE family toxin [Synergistaceae bacterium]|nr:type II toxin-antitoxin system RelE/ParE family toxin [Synergistaceae bacterium]
MAVELEPLNIIYYEKEDGTMPAKEFIESMDEKLQAKMKLAVDMLKVRGRWLRLPHSKNLENGIYELRAQIGTNAARVLYFFVTGNNAVLTNGFIKKTQKTPVNELNRAKRYMRDYLNRVSRKEKSNDDNESKKRNAD